MDAEAGETPGRRLLISTCNNSPGVDLPDPFDHPAALLHQQGHGSGIGLSLARQVMLAHGGDVAVRLAAPSHLVVTLTF